MATVATPYDRQITAPSRAHQQLRRLLGGAAVFDAGMGIACLAAADTFSGWLSISTAAVRTTSIVFFVAAAAGVHALRSKPVDLRRRRRREPALRVVVPGPRGARLAGSAR